MPLEEGAPSYILMPPAGGYRNLLVPHASSWRRLVPGRSSADALSVFTVKALRSAMVSVVARLRWFRFCVFSLAFGVGSACGRGGFVFVLSCSIASYIDIASKFTSF